MPELMPPMEPDERPEDRIRKKHNQYYIAGRRYRFLYYATRLIGGLCAGTLPFVVYSAPTIATSLSIVIVVVTVADAVFSPKELWKSNSRASDLLYIADLKRQGKFKEFEEALNVILTNEDEQMLRLMGLDEVMKKAQSAAQRQDHGPSIAPAKKQAEEEASGRASGDEAR